jgi:alpha-N-arabinofuranosidase
MAKITVNLDRPLGDVNPFVFGQFIEHMHRCVYGGIYKEDSMLSDENGFRQDVLEAIRGLKPPILRWPGGNFVSGYHWEDGVGPKDKRPRRLELAWPTPGGTEESNRFGTDEFIQYCRLLDTEPYICINLGIGTLDEARNWVEYCNGTTNTYYANLRRQNGHPEPYNVKYWGLGNEMYGAWQLGAKSAEEYARYAQEAAKLMKLVDPSIKLIACGHNGISEWDRIVLETLAPYVEYHSIHIYTGCKDYYANVFLPHLAEHCIRHLAAMIDGVRFRQKIQHPIKIAYDEWNVWDRSVTAESGYEPPYNLGDALAVAAYLNIFLRAPQEIGMANLAQTVNVLGAMITSPEGMYLQTIYHPLKLYAEHCGPIAVDTYVGESEQITVSPDVAPGAEYLIHLESFDYLDVSATCDPDAGTLTVCVVNRHKDEAISTQLVVNGGEVTGDAKIYEVNGAGPNARNSFAQPDAVTVRSRAWSPAQMHYNFPAHSVTVMKFDTE